VWFVRWELHIDIADNYFIDLVAGAFPAHHVVLSSQAPLLVFCLDCRAGLRHFGKYAAQTGAVLVNVQQEMQTDQDPHADFVMGFKRGTNDGTGLYFPWAWTVFMFMRNFGPSSLIKPPEYNPLQLAAGKTHFCAFVFTNCNDIQHGKSQTNRTFRLSLFEKLSQYKFVHAPGACRHNIDDPNFVPRDDPRFHFTDLYENAVHYYKKFKFVFAMENAAIDGYQTEKLPGAMLANAIPIYWGNPSVAELFNPASFINLNGMSVEVAAPPLSMRTAFQSSRDIARSSAAHPMA
jgi:hypothetical protein